MKIFCCSDTHGEIPPFAGEAECFCHAGDLYNYLGKRVQGVSEKDYAKMKNHRGLVEWKQKIPCPCYFVKGNHDCYDLYNVMDQDLSEKIVQLADGLHLVGIGWSGSMYYDLPMERTLIPICERLLDQAVAQLKQGDHTIILCHFPPYYSFYGEYYEGFLFKTMTKMVEALRPLAIIQGHLHQLSGQAFTHEGTLLCFPGPQGMLLEVNGERVTAKRYQPTGKPDKAP